MQPHERSRLLVLWALVVLSMPGCCFFNLFGPSCNDGPDDNGLSADTVFWRAYTDPGTFDSWLSGQTVSRKAASCLQEQSTELFRLSQSKLRECNQMVSYTPEWNACHQASEQYTNGSVIARDLARTLQGATRFDQTEAGQYLIGLKSFIGSADWNATIDLVRRNVPPVKCN